MQQWCRGCIAGNPSCPGSLAGYGTWGYVDGSGLESCRRAGFTYQEHLTWSKCLCGHSGQPKHEGPFGKDQVSQWTFWWKMGLRKVTVTTWQSWGLKGTSPGSQVLCTMSRCFLKPFRLGKSKQGSCVSPREVLCVLILEPFLDRTFCRFTPEIAVLASKSLERDHQYPNLYFLAIHTFLKRWNLCSAFSIVVKPLQ